MAQPKKQKHADNSALQGFRQAAIALGVGLFMMVQTGLAQNKPAGNTDSDPVKMGQNAPTTQKVDDSVIKALEAERAMENAKALSAQFPEALSYVRGHLNLVSKIAPEEQSAIRADVYHSQHDGKKACETYVELAQKLKDNKKTLEANKTSSTKITSVINSYPPQKSAVNKWVDNVTNDYNDAHGKLSDEQKTELQGYIAQGLTAEDLVERNAQYEQELQATQLQQQLAAQLNPEIQMWSETLDKLYNAQVLDHLPSNMVEDRMNEFQAINLKNSHKQLANVLGTMDAAKEYSNELMSSPVTNFEYRKMAIGEGAVYVETLAAQLRGETLSESDKDAIYEQAINDSYDYDITVIDQFRDDLREEKAFVDTTSDYRALAIYLSPETVDQMAQLEESINNLDDEIAAETDEGLKTNLQSKRDEMQKDFDKNDSKIEKQVERNRGKISQNIASLYTASTMEKGLYEQAKAGRSVDAKTVSQFADNKNSVQSTIVLPQDWQSYNTAKAAYIASNDAFNGNDNNIIEHTHNRKYEYMYYNKGLTTFGTQALGAYRTGFSKSSRTHNGHTGSVSHSNGHIGISTYSRGGHGKKNYHVRFSAGYGVTTRGSGVQGLKDFLFKW